jgi:hypothetical protein
MKDFELDWDDVSGRNNPAERYRIYRQHYTAEGEVLKLLATCETEQAVGVAICTLAREGELDNAALGVLDRLGDKGRRWLVTPWLPQPLPEADG